MTEITKEQKLAIAALKRAVKRTLAADLVIIMQDGSVTVHFKSDYDTRSDMDCGFTGLKGPTGEFIEPVDSFGGIEH